MVTIDLDIQLRWRSLSFRRIASSFLVLTIRRLEKLNRQQLLKSNLLRGSVHEFHLV